MNKLTIIGNLTRDPELRTTATGLSVCSFTVAVNRRGKNRDENEADYFRVSAWRELGENCAKFLAKGRKVCVIGPVSVQTYEGRDGKTYADLNVQAQEVEFLTSLDEATRMAKAGQSAPAATPTDTQTGFTQVAMEEDELPFE